MNTEFEFAPNWDNDGVLEYKNGPSEIWSDGYWVLYIDKPMRYRHNNLFLS